ncbi:hypothetical protein [Pelomicrobium sp.]|uniref:hypothetical protein n=1 Tax=Pelomicrobium sp. TaxID=2815319 RepID=UPI002FDE22A6
MSAMQPLPPTRRLPRSEILRDALSALGLSVLAGLAVSFVLGTLVLLFTLLPGPL